MKVLLRITEQPKRLIACFTQAKILDETDIVQLGHELMQAAKQAKQSGKLVLDFRQVTQMSSAMIGKLMLLNKFLKVNLVKKSSSVRRDV